jgi:tetratricopeptide (TPR) repeat protein
MRARKPAEAIAVIEKWGMPPAGTVTGARLAWVRANSLVMQQKWEDAATAFAESARRAREVGWLMRSLAAETRRLQIARRPPEMVAEGIAAASGIVQDAKAIDDRGALLNGLLARATFQIKLGKRVEARADYGEALELARELDRPGVEGRILTNIGYVLHVHERKPDRARRYYEDALAAFERAGDKKSIPGARINLSRALSDIARYDDAIAQLDQLDRAPGSLSRASKAHRAYVRRKQGRVERSRELYEELWKTASSDNERQALALELGDLQLARGDFRGALAYFNAVPAKGSLRFRALAGEAASWGGLQDMAKCRERFAEAIKAAPSPEAKGRVELQWAAYERSAGAVASALDHVLAARKLLAREGTKDYGNAAASWFISADLLLLAGQRKEALVPLASASVFFYRLQEISRAVPAYARETLVLLGFAEAKQYLDELEKRHGTMMHILGGTSDPGVKSLGACTDAVYLHRRGAAERGDARFHEAVKLAREADDPEREAAAWAGLGLYSKKDPYAAAMRALALRDRRPERARELHPLVVGERGDDAASIALRALVNGDEPDPELAVPLVERIRADRIQLGLRGRDAILVRTLAEADYLSYVSVRGRLREARAVGKGVDEATRAFLAEAERLRPMAPLAFPRIPTLKEVQAALREGEALLLCVDDAYVSAVVAIDRERAIVRAFDPKSPFEGLDKILDKKRKLLVVPDALLTLDAATWKDGVVADAFDVRYCASAASVVAQRTRAGPKGRAAVRIVANPARIDLRHPQASDADLTPGEGARIVVYGHVKTVGTEGGSPDGVACVAEARIRAGADAVLVSVAGKADNRLIRRFTKAYEGNGHDADAALRGMRAWARTQADLRDPSRWATLVLWGAR